MGEITLDPDLRAKLNGLNEQVQVRDENGTVIGLFLPLAHYKMLLRNIEIPFTDEEIKQFRNSGGGCSLGEIWQKLGVS